CVGRIHDVFFFFSSRRRHTRWPRDWSSDVCSSDLTDVCNVFFHAPDDGIEQLAGRLRQVDAVLLEKELKIPQHCLRNCHGFLLQIGRASCRKECRSRWSASHSKKNNEGRKCVTYTT